MTLRVDQADGEVGVLADRQRRHAVGVGRAADDVERAGRALADDADRQRRGVKPVRAPGGAMVNSRVPSGSAGTGQPFSALFTAGTSSLIVTRPSPFASPKQPPGGQVPACTTPPRAQPLPPCPASLAQLSRTIRSHLARPPCAARWSPSAAGREKKRGLIAQPPLGVSGRLPVIPGLARTAPQPEQHRRRQEQHPANLALCRRHDRAAVVGVVGSHRARRGRHARVGRRRCRRNSGRGGFGRCFGRL